MSKIGLALGAGGARGIAHLGALKALEENDIKFDVITGCSMGALIGGLYCLGYDLDHLKEIMSGLKKKDIVDVYIKMISHRALLKSEKIDKILKGFFQDKVIEEAKIPFGCIAVDLVAGKQVFFTKGDMYTAVRASCSIPTIISPVEHNGMLLVDGGLLNRVPNVEAKELGADKVVAIDVMGEIKDANKLVNIFDVGLRSIDTVDYYITKTRLEQNPPDILIRPELGNMSQYKVEKLEFAYDRGYKAIIDNLDRIKQLVKE